MELIHLPLVLEVIRKMKEFILTSGCSNISSSANTPKIFLLSKQLLAAYALPLSD